MVTSIGIDIGGTNLRLALVSASGKILAHDRMVVGTSRDEKVMVDCLTEATGSLIQNHKPREKKWVVGMGVPGIVSAEKGIIYSSPHYPEWNHFALASRLQKKIKFPVFIDNDANMIALGESWKGAARDWPTFLMVTLGTGIGGGIIINSKIFQGTEGFAGEFGHTVIEVDGNPCACGSHGCWETYASATGLVNLIRDFLQSGKIKKSEREALITLLTTDRSQMPAELSALAQKGNRAAQEIYSQMGFYLGVGLASIINVTGIQRIVIGGGLSRGHRHFLPQALQELKRRTYRQTAQGVKVRLAKLGDDAGIYGAALTAKAASASK